MPISKFEKKWIFPKSFSFSNGFFRGAKKCSINSQTPEVSELAYQGRAETTDGNSIGKSSKIRSL